MAKEKNERQLQKAIELEEQDEAAAIKIYHQIIQDESTWSIPYYNLGLIYKYHGNWEKSFAYNLKATQLNQEDEAAWWNLGIASTALKKWEEAKRAWNKFGLDVEEKKGEVRMDIGPSPIRLKNEEVVWAERICPARAIINNIPLQDSGYNYMDLVLNDGAPNGTRIYNEVEYAVFDVLEIFEKSNYQTYSIGANVNSKEDILVLREICHSLNLGFENWTNSINMISKQASEGIPYKNQDSDLKKEEIVDEYNLAIATISKEQLNKILNQWKNQCQVKINWIK